MDPLVSRGAVNDLESASRRITVTAIERWLRTGAEKGAQKTHGIWHRLQEVHID
jgi:hypothetical protein